MRAIILVLMSLSLAVSCQSVRPQSQTAGDSSPSAPERVWPVSVKNKVGFIDRTGKIVVEPQFEPGYLAFGVFTKFSDGLAAISVEREDGGAPGFRTKEGFIDTTGKVVIEPQYDSVYDFSEGLAHVSIGGTGDRPAFDRKDGYIDRTGNYVWKPSR